MNYTLIATLLGLKNPFSCVSAALPEYPELPLALPLSARLVSFSSHFCILNPYVTQHTIF